MASSTDQVERSFLGGVAVVEDGAAEEREEPMRKKRKPAGTAPVAAKEGSPRSDDVGEDGSDDQGNDSEYDYNSDSHSEWEGVREWPKNHAQADADEFIDGVDGITARVQLSSALTNVWVYIDPRRLSEGRTPGTCVETVGLDPSKGVMVMLTTDHGYTSSSKCPKVLWARQVARAAMDKPKMDTYGSGETFPHEWMLCGKIQVELTRAWSQGMGPSRTTDEHVEGGHQSEQGMGGHVCRDGGSSVRKGRAAAATAAGEGKAKKKTAGGELDSAATRRAVKMICESMVVSAGIAAYVLRISKYDEQKAQLCLLEEEQRSALKAAFAEFTELKRRFPQVDEACCFDAVAEHPGSIQLQHDCVARVALGGPLLDPLPQSKEETGDGHGLFDQYRRAELKKLAETNPLVRVALTVIERLKNVTEICLVCGDQIQGHTVSMPTVCHQPSCTSTSRVLERLKRWKFEFARLPTMPPARQRVRKKFSPWGPPSHSYSGASLCSNVSQQQRFETQPDIVLVSPAGGVEGQVLNNGEVVELLIDLFRRALEGTRPELGFPDAVFGLQGAGRKRDKSVIEKVRLVLNALPSVADMQRCIRREGSLGNEAKPKASVGELSSPPLLVSQVGGGGGGVWGSAASASAAAAAAAAAAAVQIAAGAGARFGVSEAVAGVGDGGGDEEGGDARTRVPPTREVSPLNEAFSKINPLAAVFASAAADDRADGRHEARFRPTEAVAGVNVGKGGGEGSKGRERKSPTGEVSPLKEALSKINPLSYPLLEWLLSTAHGGQLRLLKEAEAIQGISCKKQFVLTDTSEREERFQAMKREAAASSNGTGSFFAFHGSASGNWHGILRLGIKNMSGSEYMSNGATSGRGIYMGGTLAVSLSYTRDRPLARAALRNRLREAEQRAARLKATPFSASAAIVPTPAVVAAAAAAAASSASGADPVFTPSADSPANACACGINPCAFATSATAAAPAAAAARLHACARDATNAGGSSIAGDATSTTLSATAAGGSLSTRGVAFCGSGGYGTWMNQAAASRPTQAASAGSSSNTAVNGTSVAPTATASVGSLSTQAIAFRGRSRYGNWMNQSAVTRPTQAASASGTNTAVNAVGVAPAATAFDGSLSTQGVAFLRGSGHGNGVSHSRVNRPTASSNVSNIATNAPSAAPATTAWMNQAAVNRPTQAANVSGSSTASNATSVAITALVGSLSTQAVAFRGAGGHGNTVDPPAVNRPTQTAGARGSNTAVNATGVAPAANSFVGSLPTQGVAFRGVGGHGNRVDPPAVNVPQAPAIVALRSVGMEKSLCGACPRLSPGTKGISHVLMSTSPLSIHERYLPLRIAGCSITKRRPGYKRNRCLVIPDESCVATRFLLIDPRRPSLRLVNGDLAAAAATRYASIHSAL
ncbi:unnamed protein product [Ectocarpus sp. 4 AP-2014]